MNFLELLLEITVKNISAAVICKAHIHKKSIFLKKKKDGDGWCTYGQVNGDQRLAQSQSPQMEAVHGLDGLHAQQHLLHRVELDPFRRA